MPHRLTAWLEQDTTKGNNLFNKKLVQINPVVLHLPSKNITIIERIYVLFLAFISALYINQAGGYGTIEWLKNVCSIKNELSRWWVA